MSTIIGQRAAARAESNRAMQSRPGNTGGAVEQFLHTPAVRMALPFVNGGLSGMVSF